MPFLQVTISSLSVPAKKKTHWQKLKCFTLTCFVEWKFKKITDVRVMWYVGLGYFTFRRGLRQWVWCPLSQPSHSSMLSASPLRLHIRQRALRTDRDQMMLRSRVDKWTNTWWETHVTVCCHSTHKTTFTYCRLTQRPSSPHTRAHTHLRETGAGMKRLPPSFQHCFCHSATFTAVWEMVNW